MDDSKIARLRRRYQGLSRISAAINDLYLFGIYPGNFPNLTADLEEAKDKVKEVIQETKKDIDSDRVTEIGIIILGMLTLFNIFLFLTRELVIDFMPLSKNLNGMNPARKNRTQS